ncbi:hypothetical protein Tco_1067374 [Tanacetum coccineum]|uniref:Uncharacterized protein n=1 Tax=Tanacetum coccineum TaxID=301880 RepID=A0ABQ5HEI8_9ASTR
MDDPNITMKEYIKLEVEEARRFPAYIVYEMLALEDKPGSMTISHRTHDSDNDKVEFNISLNDIIVEPSDGVIDVKIDTHFHEFDENCEASHDILGTLSISSSFANHCSCNTILLD